MENGKRFPLYQYLSYNLHSSFEPEWFFFVDLILTFKWCYEHWWKFLYWYLGPLFMASKDKANIGNPKANRGCPPTTVNHTSGECVKLMRTPISYIEMRHPHTRGSMLWKLTYPNSFILRFFSSIFYSKIHKYFLSTRIMAIHILEPLFEPILDIVNSIHRNKLQWNPKQNSYIFIHENAFENAVCEMAAILSGPHANNHSQMVLYNSCHQSAVWNCFN